MKALNSTAAILTWTHTCYSYDANRSLFVATHKLNTLRISYIKKDALLERIINSENT